MFLSYMQNLFDIVWKVNQNILVIQLGDIVEDFRKKL